MKSPLLRSASSLAVLTLVGMLAGCSLTPRIVERDPKSADEVGTIGVAVVAAAPFEVFAGELRPGFDIDGKKALEMAMATTRQVEDSNLQSIQAALKLAPEQLSSERKSSSSTDAAGKVTETASQSTTAQAGDVSKVTATTPADTLPAVLDSRAPQATVNPLLAHYLATALLQDIKLLNRYVNSAPALKEYTPFIVRTQINVRQFGRNTPYDAQVDLVFEGKGQSHEVVVVPLLMSDSMDLSSASVARSQARAFAAGLAALRGNFGLGLDVGSRTAQLLRSLGTEVNPVLSVGQLGTQRNALSVHIGASEKGVDTHELLSRAHYVTALVLVKLPAASPDDQTRVGSFSVKPLVTYRHARTGIALPPVSQQVGSDQGLGFELAYWEPPVLPDVQLARLVLKGSGTAGTDAPFSGEVELRGGDNLLEGMFTRGCLRATDTLAGATLNVVGRTAGPVRGYFCAGADARLASRLEVSSPYRTLKLGFDGLALASPSSGAGPKVDGANFVCFDTAAEYRTLKVPQGLCMAITPALAKTPKAPPRLEATVTVDEPRVLADRQGRARLALSVRVSDVDEKSRPDRIEITLSGAGVQRVERLGGATDCVTRTAVLVVRGDCSFALHLQNATPANALTLVTSALKQFKGEKEETSVSITPSRTTVEVTPELPGLAVVLPGTPGLPVKP